MTADAPSRAALLAIGDEIVAGLIADTNSALLADLLRAEGIEVASIFAVPDDIPAIRRAIERAFHDAELVVTTGGLGPTADDLTTAAVASAVHTRLELHEPSLHAMEERFRVRALPMPANNRKQAMLPAGCAVVPNPRGTAPGFVCTTTRDGLPRTIASLPGVPAEMEPMARETLLPLIRESMAGRPIGSRVFSVFGLSESALDELLEGVVDPAEARLAFRASFPRLQARVTTWGDSDEEVTERLDDLERRVRERLGDHVYATGDAGLEDVVGALLADSGRTLAVAESCTGGLIGNRITDVAGSSTYFNGGVVAYSNAAKIALLGVGESTLAEHGAVSNEVALEMAHGARTRLGADLGVATTGIAGPGGGTAEKPVGTVCIALAWEGGEWSRRYALGSRTRAWVKAMTAQLALDLARRWLLGSLDAQ